MSRLKGAWGHFFADLRLLERLEILALEIIGNSSYLFSRNNLILINFDEYVLSQKACPPLKKVLGFCTRELESSFWAFWMKFV